MRDSSVRRWSGAHKHLYRLTGGRVGGRLVANDMLLLTTRGRSTGRRHTVPLLFLTDGDRFIVIASYGGRDDHPDWYLNLVADPRVTVQIGSDKRRMSARTATAEERSRWWPEVIDAYDAYAVYQRRTERQIPVVVVEPAGREKTTDNLATDVDC